MRLSLRKILIFLRLMMEVITKSHYSQEFTLISTFLVKHKHKHLGYGMCRGAKWTDRIWPLMRGYKTLQECANSCGRTKGCTAFDISKEDSGRFDCMLYGHKHPVPAPGVPGDCYTIPGAVYVEEVHEEEKAPLRRPSILDEDEEDYTNIGNTNEFNLRIT